jgi:hypothetical protein
MKEKAEKQEEEVKTERKKIAEALEKMKKQSN